MRQQVRLSRVSQSAALVSTEDDAASRRGRRRVTGAGTGRHGLGRSGGSGRFRTLPRLLPYLLVGPSLLAMLVLLGWPMVKAVLISFQQLDLAQFFSHQTVWVGVDNYTEILSDPFFWTVTVRTVVFTVCVVAATMVLGLAVAVLMENVAKSIRLVLSVVMVMAWAMPQITATVVFQWMFDEQFGVVNGVLSSWGFDMENHAWFGTGLSTFTIIGMLVVWQAIPFVALSLYASMTAVPGELKEAAASDGAGPVQSFVAVTWPAIRSMMLILTFLSVIWDFKAFTQVYAVRQGGPAGKTVTLSVYAYLEGVSRHHYGTAAAISLVMVALLLVLLAGYVRLMVRSLEEER
jgi:N,N'-diacetylchitobiose transport system permease protein